MVLIEALHNIQRILGRIIKPLIGIPLQLRQVIEKGRLRLLGVRFTSATTAVSP